jgi:hypothetical protein
MRSEGRKVKQKAKEALTLEQAAGLSQAGALGVVDGLVPYYLGLDGAPIDQSLYREAGTDVPGGLP